MKRKYSQRLAAVTILGAVVAVLTAKHKTTSNETPVYAQSSAEPALPTCGRENDGRSYVPPDWETFTPPPVGQTYKDPVFGCRVKRITDSEREEVTADGKHLSFMGYYSTLSPINASDTMIFIFSNNGSWRIKNIDGEVLVSASKMPTMNSGHPVWSANDGNAFYYTQGQALRKGTVAGSAVHDLDIHDFREYKGIVSPDTSDLSQDGDHIALVGQNSDDTMDVFVWSLTNQRKTSVYRTTCKVNQWGVTQTPQPGCVHKLLLTPDNELAIDFTNDGTGFEQGLRLWDGKQLMHLQDRTNHADTGYDMEGREIFIESGNPYYTHGLTNPCPSGWGLDVRMLKDPTSAKCLLDKLPGWHVSYRGDKSQPWAALSYTDNRKPGPELFDRNPQFQTPSASNWQLYEDEIQLVRIDGKMLFRLAQARSRSTEGYWSEPHAAISRDGEYVVFTSNMAHPDGCPANGYAANECTDVYLIKVH